jgi:hypothetical protein
MKAEILLVSIARAAKAKIKPRRKLAIAQAKHMLRLITFILPQWLKVLFPEKMKRYLKKFRLFDTLTMQAADYAVPFAFWYIFKV